jgi:hypothetical protein
LRQLGIAVGAQLSRRLQQGGVERLELDLKRRPRLLIAAIETAHEIRAAVQLDNIGAACPRVQPIHVLHEGWMATQAQSSV